MATVLDRNVLWRNRGDGTFEDVRDPALVGPHVAWSCVAEDVNHDGFIDVMRSSCYQEWFTDPQRGGLALTAGEEAHYKEGTVLLLNSASGDFEDVTAESELLPGPEHQGLECTLGFQIGDLDLDGNLDVLLGNGGTVSKDTPGLNRLISLVPDGVQGVRSVDRTEALGERGEGQRSHGSLFFDYDQDDDIDLFIGNGGFSLRRVEPNQLYRNQSASTPNWVKVNLQGTVSNRDGVGSLERVADAPPGEQMWQVYRRQSLSSGFMSTVPRTLVVGLGSRPGPYHVSVTWPGGVVQVISNVDSRSELLVVEASGEDGPRGAVDGIR